MDTINAKTELQECVKYANKELSDIKCAFIAYEEHYNEYNNIILKENWSDAEWDEFITKLDFSYDCGYGGQELHGHVVFDDNTWLERGEYDGSEWWSYKEPPHLKECER